MYLSSRKTIKIKYAIMLLAIIYGGYSSYAHKTIGYVLISIAIVAYALTNIASKNKISEYGIESNFDKIELKELREELKSKDEVIKYLNEQIGILKNNEETYIEIQKELNNQIEELNLEKIALEERNLKISITDEEPIIEKKMIG
jgi:hypothetical protein